MGGPNWYPLVVSGGNSICSFRQFLAKTYHFARIQNVTDRQTTDRRHLVTKARPIVRSAKNVIACTEGVNAELLLCFQCSIYNTETLWVACESDETLQNHGEVYESRWEGFCDTLFDLYQLSLAVQIIRSAMQVNNHSYDCRVQKVCLWKVCCVQNTFLKFSSVGFIAK